jgi:hypothetical protein
MSSSVPGFSEEVPVSAPLFWWLLIVASLRLLSVVLGYFFPPKLLDNVFGNLPVFPPVDDGPASAKSDIETRACDVCAGRAVHRA